MLASLQLFACSLCFVLSVLCVCVLFEEEEIKRCEEELEESEEEKKS